MKEKIKSEWITRDKVRAYLPVFALVFVVVLFAVLTKGSTVKINNLKQIMLQSCT